MTLVELEPSVARYLDRASQAPRLTSLAPEFALIASGAAGRPQVRVELNPDFLGSDAEALAFAKIHGQRAGVFNEHYIASVPYVLEEQCRFGVALWRYGFDIVRRCGRRAYVYTLGDAAGVTARTLAQVGEGAIRTLTCSPTLENHDQFFALGAPPDADFFLGPFFDVTPEAIQARSVVSFEGGFDVLVEDTTFQMYGPERYEPIVLACRNLRDDGIFVLIEKLRHVDIKEYLRRENQKDSDFKARYFNEAQIEQKRSAILQHMSQMEASLDEITSALKRRFAAAVVTWNSGNFYTIAASVSTSNLKRFIHGLLPPALPAQFCYERLPMALFGIHDDSITFRQTET